MRWGGRSIRGHLLDNYMQERKKKQLPGREDEWQNNLGDKERWEGERLFMENEKCASINREVGETASVRVYPPERRHHSRVSFHDWTHPSAKLRLRVSGAVQQPDEGGNSHVIKWDSTRSTSAPAARQRSQHKTDWMNYRWLLGVLRTLPHLLYCRWYLFHLHIQGNNSAA